MLEKTNKILIILVAILIALLIVAVIMFSAVIKNTNKEVEQHTTALSENKLNPIDIDQIEDKNEVLVAYLDGEQENLDNSVIEIGTDTELNNVVENNSSPYYIKVNVQANTVTIYKKDGNGNYNIPLKSMICSCGAETPVEGTYSLKKYNNWQWKTVSGGAFAQYATQISGDILFQSVPYSTKGDKTTLKYEEYDKLGTICTKSSIALKVIDSKWIYENCPAGTQVTFYTSETPGPLGKPTSQLITEDELVRGWDPTDPDENNPWKNYVRPEKKEENNQENEQNNTENTTPNNENSNVTENNNDNTVDNNTTGNNNTVDENNNNLANDNTTGNNATVDDNSENNNSSNNNQTDSNRKPENRVLEENDDVTIKSEVIDRNTL